MPTLTPEQIKTIEDAFASYPEDFPTTSKYASMKGIQEQLEELNGEPGFIFYISKACTLHSPLSKKGARCTIDKMKIGEPE